MKKKIIGSIIILSLMVGITLGFFLKSFSNEMVTEVLVVMGRYGCHDGCSIATKDSDGWLTNETWDCWDECDKYMNEIEEDFK